MKHVAITATVVLCVVLLAARPRGAGTDAGGYEVLANAFGFGVDIPGAVDASRNIREISIDELTFDIRETTTGLDVEYRLYQSGGVHFGTAKFTFHVDPGNKNKELTDWVDDAARGNNIRKNITVTLFKRDKTAGRSYTLVDAEPVAYYPPDPGAPNPIETLTVKIGRIDFHTRAANGGSGKPRNGFHSDISSPNDPLDVDNGWETAVGGVTSHEEHPMVLGLRFDPTIDTHAHKTCTDLTLRGPMTDARFGVVKWFNERSARNVVLSVGSHRDGHVRHVYEDAIPVGYVFPRMSVTNTTGNVMEEIRIKPIRCELK